MKKLFYLFLVLGLFACNIEPVDDTININPNLESEFKGLWSGHLVEKKILEAEENQVLMLGKFI